MNGGRLRELEAEALSEAELLAIPALLLYASER